MFHLDYNISARKEFPPYILRIAKIAKQKSKINSKAKAEQNQSQTVRPADLKLKRKPGAPKGNRNARKHGLYTGEMRDLRLRVRLVIADAKCAVAEARMVAALMDAESRLRASGLALPDLPAFQGPVWPACGERHS